MLSNPREISLARQELQTATNPGVSGNGTVVPDLEPQLAEGWCPVTPAECSHPSDHEQGIQHDLSCRLSSISLCLGACQALLAKAEMADDLRKALGKALEMAHSEVGCAGEAVRSSRALLESRHTSPAVQSINGIVQRSLDICHVKLRRLRMEVRVELGKVRHTWLDTRQLTPVIVALIDQAISANLEIPEHFREIRIRTQQVGAVLETRIAFPTTMKIDGLAQSSTHTPHRTQLREFQNLERLQEIVRQHRGRLTAANAPGGRCELCLSLPCHPSLAGTGSTPAS